MPALSREVWILEGVCLAIAIALLAHRARAARGTLVDERDGLGRRIVVRDRAGFRELTFTDEDGVDEMLQARVSLASPLVSGIPYTDGLHLAALVAPRVERVLFIGGGPLLVPRQFLALYPRAEVQVAEIDPAVVDVAREHFFVPSHPRLSITVGDGREALEGYGPGALDAILVDAFGVGTTPRRLASGPFFALCRERLRPGGCLVVNLAGELVGPEGALLRRIYAGVREAFGASRVAAFGVPGEGNTIAVATRDAVVPASDLLVARAARLPRAMLPHLEGILGLRLDVDTAGLRPFTDPADGQEDVLLLD